MPLKFIHGHYSHGKRSQRKNIIIMLIKTTNFQTKVSERYQNVQSSGDLCDVTLVSEDKGRIDAHKVILATASSVLKDLFGSLNHAHPMIFMRGVSSNQLNSMI